MMPGKPNEPGAEKAVRDIRRVTRRRYSAEEKLRIVLEGLRGEDSIAERCRREGLNANVYYRWSKEFLGAGKKLCSANISRFILVLLSRMFAWKDALVNVTPKTFIGWHRAGFRLFWRWKSRPGRPRISPRTRRKYMPKRQQGQPRGDQRWSVFLTNHAKVIVACDFLTVVTATFKCLYVFVIIELGTRKLLHIHVTDHPTASWTLQQLREAISSGHSYRFLIRDRDCIFSSQLDQSITYMGLRVLKTPYRSPKN